MEDNNLINLFVLMIINLLSYLALLSCAMSLVEYILCCWEDKLKEENAQQNILVIISDCNIPIRIITISTISVIICLIYLACGLHYEILPNGKNILFFIAIFGLAIHLWIMRSKVTRIQKPNKIIEQERLDENELFRTIILKNIIAWPAIHVLAIFVGVVVGLLSYIYFQCIIMGFIIGIVTMIFLLLFLSFVLYICKIPIDTFTNSACFKDDECVFYLLYIPCITIMWDCIYLYKSEYTEYTFLIIFPFIVMILLLLVFMYRIGAGKTHVATEYQGNKKRKVWTIAFFIIIQLQIFIMGVMCVQLRGTGLVWSCDLKDEPIRLLNIIYFVIMTYTSVGYGELLPFGTCMKIIVTIISISAIFSSVLLIGTICNMFHDENDKTFHSDEKFPYVDLYKKLNKRLSRIKDKVQEITHNCKYGRGLRNKFNYKHNGFLHALLFYSKCVFIFSVITGILVIFQKDSFKIESNNQLLCTCHVIRNNDDMCICSSFQHNIIHLCCCRLYNIITIVYYVIITFTSVGYGDITPATGLAKCLACVISLVGYISSAYLLSTIYETIRK